MRKLFIILFSVYTSHAYTQKLQSGNSFLEVNEKLKTKLGSLAANSITLMQNFSESEYLVTRHEVLGGFEMINSHKQINNTSLTTFTFKGQNASDIIKETTITIDSKHPDVFIFHTNFINSSEQSFAITKYVLHDYSLASYNDTPAFYSFQGESTGNRNDWILPVDSNFFQQNYMGMNNSDYGGGIPVTDIWRKDMGIAMGSLETVAQLISLPVEHSMQNKSVRTWIEKQMPEDFLFEPGDTISTIETFVMLHTGDCFSALHTYAEMMQERGIQFPKSAASAFEPIWCAWGYERDFTLDEIINTLPKVKELGFGWVGLDDGFQIDQGNWHLNAKKFPNGEADMKRFVDAVHALGMKAQLWWAPLAVSPQSSLLKNNPDILLRNADWSPQFITWWDSWYLSPTDSVVIEHTKETVKMFLQDWNFDGLKLDGQHMNFCPADYKLENPDASFEQLPQFFKTIYNTAHAIKPDALVQFCPCGCCMNFYNLIAIDQTVASDPESSFQIRSKGLVYKAINPGGAYFGDHVELSDNKNDFASQFGVGAVLGTKFTYPKDNPTQSESFLLTPEKEKERKLWMQLYAEKMLSTGNYLGNLYDIGYDKPEAHVIEKNNKLNYAFYADTWNGAIYLKGLDAKKNYVVYDYVHDKTLAEIKGENPVINARFEGSLLVEVRGE